MHIHSTSFALSAPLRHCVRFVLLAIALGGWGRASGEPPVAKPQIEQSLQKACEYLWSQQADDGGWHSGQYGVLRSGQALTPFVLNALLNVPESTCPRPTNGVERALAFIRSHVDDQGALGHSDPDIAEYPVYSTAYALLCLARAGQSNDFALAQKMNNYLVKVQYQDENGFDPSMPCYGGWGLDAPRHPGESGHMDLAHTRRALQALKTFDRWWHESTGAVCGKNFIGVHAEMFLHVVQRHPDAVAAQPGINPVLCRTPSIPYDGGFYFSPVVAAANKGRVEETEGASYFRSYATATCDGVLALLAAGVDRKDERVASAVNWLADRENLDYPQGVPTDFPEPWGEAIRFYHYAVRAEAYAALDWSDDWRERLGRAVAERQAADGSFQNTASPLMKEDDPIECTTLAVTALSRCLETDHSAANGSP